MDNNLPLHSRLKAELKQLLPWIRNTQAAIVAALVVAVQRSRGIHLGQIANQLPGTQAQTPSIVNRLHRFVCNERIVPQVFFEPFVAALFAQYRGAEIRLVTDVSKVGLGTRMLTVSLACHRRTIPIAWSVHAGVKGAVAVSKQIALLEAVSALVPPESCVSLLADAGFEATELVRWLLDHGWAFTLRRPGCHKVRTAPRDAPAATIGSADSDVPVSPPADLPLPEWVRLADVPIQPGQTRSLGTIQWTEKAALGPLSLTLHWGENEDEPWYLISTAPTAHAAVRHYRLRMWVEEMYGDLKEHGFDLEATHLRHCDRIERLMLVLCINYVWFIALGSWVVKSGRRRRIDHKSRRDKSYFRLGLDWIHYCFRCNLTIQLRFVPYLSK